MKILYQSIKMIVLMTLLTGVVYPLSILLIAHLTMPWQAQGSLIYQNDLIVGSQLIGQKFENKRYFWGRPSAVQYDTLPAGASNLGPTSAKLRNLIRMRRIHVAQAHDITDLTSVPVELITASASGIDPHINFNSAYFQINRIAKARSMETHKQKIEELINLYADKPIGKLFGAPHVNVLMLNLALDHYEKQMKQ